MFSSNNYTAGKVFLRQIFQVFCISEQLKKKQKTLILFFYARKQVEK